MASLHLRILVLLNLVARSFQADPIKDFCRRWAHSTAQIDGRIYIDGGMVSYNPPALNYSNPSLVFSDLRTSPPGGDLNMPTQHANLSRPGYIPSVLGGYIWADQTNKCFYQVGGEYPPGASPTDFSLWTYDTLLDQWNSTNYKTSLRTLQRVSYGAGTQVESRGLGFYFGGWLNEKTTPGWKGAAIATSGILQYDFTTGVLTNNTGPDDNIGRAEGQMVYLPRSDGGVLVYFGGIEDPYRNGTYLPANMSRILIYDIASGRWYNQTASGQAPPTRRQFCADVSSPDDGSSFNIYLYGGYGFGTPAGFNDAYVLSLPSFTWIRVYPLDGTDVGDFGHGGCTANIVNRNQMIVMGGWFPKETTCDAKDVQGQHNMVLGNNTVNKKMWDAWDPRFTAYAIPEAVVSAIGGGPTGGATVRSPATWDHNNLRTYYTLTPQFKTRSATRALPATTTPSPSNAPLKKINVGAIAGSVVGGLVVLIIILVLILFCLHRRKKAHQTPKETPTPAVQPAELGVTSVLHEIATSPASKYMAVHDRQASHNHVAYGSLAPTQNRLMSYDQASAPSYHSTTPAPTQRGEHFHQHESHGQYAGFNQQTGQPKLDSLQQRQYSYPSPTSPQQMEQHIQGQTYYPPPGELDQRTNHADHSVSERRSSPAATHYSAETRHTGSPHASNMTTPAQFYAQPAAALGSGQYGG